MVGAQKIFGLVLASGVVLLTAGLEAAPTKSLATHDTPTPRCPRNMSAVAAEGLTFCIDRYEAAVVEVTPAGKLAPHSPFEPVTGKKVKAISAPNVVPQGYISGLEAKAACENAGKRLCTPQEWEVACRGRSKATYPYGDNEVAGRCNTDRRKQHPVVELFSSADEPFQSFEKMNDPRINQLPKTVSKTGAHASCKSSFGVYDLVGNLHEWTSDPKGQFRGGYYMDTHKNGDGCGYRTVAHDVSYHDYSTGFRCCK